MTRLPASGRFLLACLAGSAPGPAAAGLTEAELASVALAPPADARVPDLVLETAEGASLALRDAIGGRPTLLLPVDARCRSVCGPALSLLAGSLGETGLVPGRDYRVVLLGIGGRGGADLRGFVAAQGGPALGGAVTAFSGPPEAIRRVTDAVGFRFAPDPGNDAVAHPSAFLALTGEGRVSRTLSSLALNPADLRLAVLEAGAGRVGGLGDRLRVLCYAFDPVRGIYTARIHAALGAGAAATILLLAGGLLWLGRRYRDGGAAP